MHNNAIIKEYGVIRSLGNAHIDKASYMYDFTKSPSLLPNHIAEDIRAVASTPEGKRLLVHILSQTGLGSGVSNQDIYNFGVSVLGQIIEATPPAHAASILIALYNCGPMPEGITGERLEG